MTRDAGRWGVLPSFEAGVLAVFFFLALRPPMDSDTFLHLASGRHVLESGVPLVDPFSHTIAGREWLAHEWLAATVMELVSRIGGLGLVVWMGALVSVLTLAALVKLMDVEEITSPVARTAALLAAGVCMRNVVLARPHMFTLLFLALELLVLARVRRGGSLATLLALPPMFVVWGNMHGGFVLGGLPLGMAGLDALQDARRGEAGTWRRFGVLFACGLACVAALLLNPHGAQLLAFPFAFDPRAAHLSLVDEWALPDYRAARPQEMVLLALLLVPLMWPARARLGEVVGLGAAVHLALSAVRNQFLLGLFGATVLARCVQQGAAGELAGLDRRATVMMRGKGTAIPVAVLVLTALVWAPAQSWVNAERFPAAAAEWIDAAEPGGTMFNEYDAGGYLLWRLGRKAPVFIDGRIEIYSRHGLLADYLAIAEARPEWRDLLHKHGVGFCLVHDASPLAAALAQRTEWTRAFQGDGVSVFVLDLGRPPLTPPRQALPEPGK